MLETIDLCMRSEITVDPTVSMDREFGERMSRTLRGVTPFWPTGNEMDKACHV